MTIPPRTRDTVSSAAPNSAFPPPPHTRRDRKSSQEVNNIRAQVDQLRRSPDARHTPVRASGPRVVVVFLVSRLSMIPMFLFVIIPRKTMEIASPIAAKMGTQFLAVTGNFMNLMSRVAENVAQSFAPIKKFVNRVQESFNSAYQSGMQAYKALQKTLTHIAAKIKIPAGLDFTPLMKNLHEWARRVTDFKQIYKNISHYLANVLTASKEGGKENTQFLAKVVKTVRKMNAAIDRQLERLGQKVQSKIKQVKEKVVDPVKNLFETVTREVQQMTMAAFARIQTHAQPVINLAAIMGNAVKTYANGKMQNFLEVIRTFSSNVQSAVMSVAKGVMHVYNQILVQNVILPFIASIQAGWGRIANVQQRIQAQVVERFNAVIRELKDMVRRLAARLQSLFGAIQGWAQRKWKQQWLPALKKIPKKAGEIGRSILRIGRSFWKALLATLMELVWLFAEFGKRVVSFVRDVFREVTAQNANWK